MARETIHVDENEYISVVFYLIIKILPLISHLCHFIMVLSNQNDKPRIFKVCGKIFTSLSRDFTENPYSMFLTRPFLFVNRFSIRLLHILRQNKCSTVPRKYYIYI